MQDKPSVFSRLELLEALTHLVKVKDSFAGSPTILVGAQHLLATTGTLIEQLSLLGIKPENMYFLGKHYSANHQVIHLLTEMGVSIEVNDVPTHKQKFRDIFISSARKVWKKVISRSLQFSECRVVILDDGGAFVESMPLNIPPSVKVIAVEQTTSGIEAISKSVSKVKVIDVARSWAKTQCESDAVGRAIINGIEKIIGPKARSSTYGIVGLGAVGRSLAIELMARDLKVLGYDIDETVNFPSGVIPVQNAKNIISGADIIVGCTGTDCFCKSDLPEVLNGFKWFASGSSEDIEFRSLITAYDSAPTTHLDLKVDAIEIVEEEEVKATILRQGYPVNFDGGIHSVPPQEIQITRALLLAAVAQALDEINSNVWNIKETIMLSPTIQALIISHWLKLVPQHHMQVDEISEDACRRGSSGNEHKW